MKRSRKPERLRYLFLAMAVVASVELSILAGIEGIEAQPALVTDAGPIPSGCESFKEICTNVTCGLDCPHGRWEIPCSAEIFSDHSFERVSACKPAEQPEPNAKRSSLGVGLSWSLEELGGHLTRSSNFGTSSREEIEGNLHFFELEIPWRWQPDFDDPSRRFDLSLNLGRAELDFDTATDPRFSPDTHESAWSLGFSTRWESQFCRDCRWSWGLGYRFKTLIEDGDLDDLSYDDHRLETRLSARLSPAGWLAHAGLRARGTDLRAAWPRILEGDIERRIEVEVEREALLPFAGLEGRIGKSSLWGGLEVGIDDSDLQSHVWLTWRPRTRRHSECFSDSDCDLGSVCETKITGECDSPLRECVPGCRASERGCDNALHCFDVTCKTCPCPDLCLEPVSQACGLPGDAPCPEDMYCQFASGVCGSEQGQCVLKPTLCPPDYTPVCGCDGVTYRSPCSAQFSGVNVAHSGACEDDEVDPVCPNGDLELGDLSGWEGFTGTYKKRTFFGCKLDVGSPGLVDGRHTLMPDPPDWVDFDPKVGGSILPVVYEGNSALRLGNADNEEAERVKYRFEVTDDNKDFRFTYAVALEAPDHKGCRNPFFEYRVYVGDKWPWLPWSKRRIERRKVVADKDDPYFKAGPGRVVYRNWTPVCLDLSDHVGEEVTLELATADCTYPSGHFGYAYIDGVCRDNSARAVLDLANKACGSDGGIVADGTASVGETDHFWSIEKSDASWGRNPETEVSKWFIAQQAGTKNLTQLYSELGGSFECNTYYRIKLAVRNDCTTWDEDVKLLYIQCPEVDAGPDQDLCCNDSASVTLGTQADPDLRYSWTSDPSGFLADTPRVTVSPRDSRRYTLTVTDGDGCRSEDQVDVFVFDDFRIRSDRSPASFEEQCQYLETLSPLILPKPSACNQNQNPILEDLARNRWRYEWSTGESTPSIRVDPLETTEYEVTVSNPCYSDTTGWVIKPCPRYDGSFPELIYPNAFSPNDSAPNNIFRVYHLGLADGARPAYNALGWTFRVWDRWGHEVVVLEDSALRCDGFANGDIPAWDGRATRDGKKAKAGSPLPQGVYNWRLWLKNCRWPHGKQLISHRKCTRYLFWESCKTKELGELTIVR